VDLWVDLDKDGEFEKYGNDGLHNEEDEGDPVNDDDEYIGSISAAHHGTYDEGTLVKMEANIEDNGGIVTWLGDAKGHTATQIFTMNKHISVAAIIEQVVVDVHIDSNNNLELDAGDENVEDTESFDFWINNDDDGNRAGFGAKRDCDDFVIKNKKDLEDFAQLDMELKINHLLEPQKVQYFTQLEGGGAIGLCEKLENDNMYLKDDAAAGLYVGHRIYVTHKGKAIIDGKKREFSTIGDPETPTKWLFEGIRPGSGKLKLKAKYWDQMDDETISEDSALLHLADLLNGDPELYSIANFRSGQRNWEYSSNFDNLAPSTTVFVHGYNVA